MNAPRSFCDGREWYVRAGSRWWLDRRQTIDRSIIDQGVWEPATTKAVEQFAPRGGDDAIDVGANLGWYTLLLARLVGPAGRRGASAAASCGRRTMPHRLPRSAPVRPT